MSSFCTVQREGPLFIVTMNRPDKLNALPANSHAEMEIIWDEFAADDSARIGILTGAGDRAFCAGSDLSIYESGQPFSLPRTGGGGLTHRFDCPKPIIAAVNGLAFGGGFEIMLACDLAVAVESAEFALPEVLVGAGAFGGGIPRLCRKLPHAIALELVLTGRRLAAADAQRLGLLNKVVPRGAALEAARALARDVLAAAPLAVAASKQVADLTLDGLRLHDVLAWEDGEPRRRVMGSEDLQEGIRAFFGKRPPVWQGR